ncbi:MAG: outer membrane beta-barrel protein [Cyanobium sp. LacPavin_0920_WC12_MAG_62_9]|nr:outer membrane beta-barrel protein [Cyanobium sp. LacPavin_0920_WC12_MAG_62_9]
MTLLRPIIIAIAATSLSVCSVSAAKAESDASDPYGKTASQASATSEKGFYATVGLGGAWPQNVTGNTTILGVGVTGSYALGGGFSGDIGAGYDFGPVRTELTYAYTGASLNSVTATALGTSGTTSISNGSVSTNSVLVSAYVDIPTKSKFTPYIGGGLGYTNVGWGAYSASALGITLTQQAGSQGVLGYQAKLGVSYQASAKADVFVEGTYQGSSGFSVDRVNYNSLSAFGARVGARYRF